MAKAKKKTTAKKAKPARGGGRAIRATAALVKPVKAVKPGSLVIDASALKPFLVDLGPGATRGLLRAQPGIDEVVAEIEANQPTYGATLGIANKDVDAFTTVAARLAQVNAFLPAVEKLAEMLRETQASLENQREKTVRIIGDSIDGKRKQKDVYADLTAAYETTLAYRSRSARAAVATRKRIASRSRAPGGGTPTTLTTPTTPTQ